jgi:hypothetical protein
MKIEEAINEVFEEWAKSGSRHLQYKFEKAANGEYFCERTENDWKAYLAGWRNDNGTYGFSKKKIISKKSKTGPRCTACKHLLSKHSTTGCQEIVCDAAGDIDWCWCNA